MKHILHSEHRAVFILYYLILYQRAGGKWTHSDILQTFKSFNDYDKPL